MASLQPQVCSINFLQTVTSVSSSPINVTCFLLITLVNKELVVKKTEPIVGARGDDGELGLVGCTSGVEASSVYRVRSLYYHDFR